MGRRRKGLPINGVLLVDKPPGMSSNGVLQRVRRIYKAQKAGHTGTLDPLATGLLPICLGEATKFSQFLLAADKHYLTTATLGVVTDTLDVEGSVIECSPVPELSEQQIGTLLEAKFLGDIQQIPPMYSALKHKGKKLYELARAGQVVERQPRPVSIYANQIHHWHSPELTLDIHCSKGTYIRSLVADLGQALGCGAHVKTLRRLQHGPFEVAQAITLSALEDLSEQHESASLQARLLPVDRLVAGWPAVTLTDQYARLCRHGNEVHCAGQPGKHRIYDAQRQFLGMGEITQNERLQPLRLLALP